jgi:LEA14-like dessication related protein
MGAVMRGVWPRFVALVLLSAVLLGGCQSLDDILKAAPKPTARITGAKLQGLSLEKVDLVFDVEVSNPYGVSLPLVELGYIIGSGEQRIVDGTAKPSGAVPANGSKVIQIPAGIQFASLLSAVKGVRPGSVVPYTAELNLGVDAPVVGRMNLPVSRSGELPVPAVPEVSLVGFDIGALSLDEVDATARLRVKNTNQFDLDLAKLGLDLALGGKQVARTSLASKAQLAPGQSATLDVPVSFSPRSVGTGVFNLLRGAEAGYGISGSLEAGTRFGPLALPFKHSGKAPISR